MTSQPLEEPAAAQNVPAERREINVRRAPKIVPFLVVGAVLGIIGAIVVAVAAPGGQDYSRTTVFGFFAALLLIPGVGLGAVVALVLDRISLRRAKTATFEAVPDSVPDTGDDAPA